MNSPGDRNRNKQQILRKTRERGTDHNAHVWLLKCLRCQNIYGSNSTDAFERKCPKCQSGAHGLPIPVERDGQDWSKEEHIIAFNLYSQIPFGTIHIRNPKVIELAAILGRKVGSISNKLANLSRFDPVLKARDINGLSHGAKGEAAVWAEFSHDPEGLAFESEKLLAKRLGQSVEQVAEVEEDDLPREGKDREAILRVRVNQSFFRKRVLSAFCFRCCVTGLETPELLVTSHIIPWAEDKENRLNSRNGLCLNALHDRAFDRHLMWVDSDFRVRFSKRLYSGKDADSESISWLTSFEGKPLLLPKNFRPEPKLLSKHAEICNAL